MLNVPKQGHPPASAIPPAGKSATAPPASAEVSAGKPTDHAFAERRVAAWVGKALRVEGRIISSEDLTIDGSVEGSIELDDHSLTIGTGAAVKADLTAKTITISGAVTGMVRATEKVDLRETGSVDGDINPPRFV